MIARRTLLVTGAAALATTATEAVAQPVRAVTTHASTFNGQPVRYTATVAETILKSADGAPAASMVNTAYVRDDVADKAKRPVMFIFNGGPGASSSPLHMGALGPRRIVKDALVENQYSVLDAVDLVFVDPVGTGLSRPLAGVDGQPFWSVTGDAASVALFIKSWLRDNGREASPHYLSGESYGTTRAGQIIATNKDLALDGVLLFSLVGGPPGPDLANVMTLPTYAAVAAFHGKAKTGGRSPERIYEDAAAFARTEYAGALTEGSNIAPADKAKMAARLSAMIGLPADFIAAKDLRISKPDFMLNLLKDRGLRTGQLDARATGELAKFANVQPPGDDPSMSMGNGSSAGILHNYLTQDLKFPTKETYKTLNLEINSKWKYDTDRGIGDAASQVAAAMRTNPKLRVFWAGGIYDITTPLSSGKYTLSHAGIPRDRLTAVAFPTGHSIFETESAVAGFTGAIRKFVAG